MGMWPSVLIPSAVAILGALYTVFRRPTDEVIGAVQHLAAGVIFCAAAAELLPDATRSSQTWPLLAGGFFGVVAMLALRSYAGSAHRPLGLLGASAVDAVIDGLVLGLGFRAGRHQGLLLAVALAVEFLFLGLSVAGSFGKDASGTRILIGTVAVSLMVPVGTVIATVVNDWPGAYQEAAFAFGLVALLYLVTEELLVEAHRKPETAWGTALFFVGFLGLAALNEHL